MRTRTLFLTFAVLAALILGFSSAALADSRVETKFAATGVQSAMPSTIPTGADAASKEEKKPAATIFPKASPEPKSAGAAHFEKHYRSASENAELPIANMASLSYDAETGKFTVSCPGTMPKDGTGYEAGYRTHVSGYYGNGLIPNLDTVASVRGDIAKVLAITSINNNFQHIYDGRNSGYFAIQNGAGQAHHNLIKFQLDGSGFDVAGGQEFVQLIGFGK